LSVWKAFYHTKAAIQTINHSLDQYISEFFGYIPESYLITYSGPSAIY